MDIRPLVLRIPLFARKFIVDAAETGAVALIGLPLIGDRDSLVHTAIAALGGAIVSAARRATPAAIAWVRGMWADLKAYLQVDE